MKGLDRIVAQLEAELDVKDRVRQAALQESRKITRLASIALRHMVRGESAGRELSDARAGIARLRALLRTHPEFWRQGSVETALQEVAEASIVEALLRGRPPPPPRSLGIPAAAYVLGLADSVGELRRLSLERMRVGKIAEATRFVESMEDLYHALLRFDYPDGIVAVRHKQDVARGMLERTRGELAVASRSAELERKLAQLSRR